MQIGEQAYDDKLDTVLDIGEDAMTVKMCSAAQAGDLKKVCDIGGGFREAVERVN